MTEDNNARGNIYNANDTLDINELASLNDDISPEFIEQLQNQVAQDASKFTGKPIKEDDSELFEEITPEPEKTPSKVNIDEAIDDNFMKKYKAKLNKQELEFDDSEEQTETNKRNEETSTKEEQVASTKPIAEETTPIQQAENTEIKELTSGNIVEKPIDKEVVDYNASLDFIDDNTKYSKYVIYIDPENSEFMDSLTVKERKNLINRILREQDDIAITKRRFNILQTALKHAIIAIITISVSVPIIYWTINSSLEASINNYRRSKTVFQTLYREKGKIKTNNSY